MTSRRTPHTVAHMASHAYKIIGLLITVAALVLLGAGCGRQSKQNKEGSTLSPAVTLKMETPDAPQADAQFFTERVAALTHGHVHVIQAPDYSSSDPDNEARLAVALRQGQAQMAYIPSRAWERDGGRVLAFRALQAPLLITSYSVLPR
jgi:hypothetical protein